MSIKDQGNPKEYYVSDDLVFIGIILFSIATVFFVIGCAILYLIKFVTGYWENIHKKKLTKQGSFSKNMDECYSLDFVEQINDPEAMWVSSERSDDSFHSKTLNRAFGSISSNIILKYPKNLNFKSYTTESTSATYYDYGTVSSIRFESEGKTRTIYYLSTMIDILSVNDIYFSKQNGLIEKFRYPVAVPSFALAQNNLEMITLILQIEKVLVTEYCSKNGFYNFEISINIFKLVSLMKTLNSSHLLTDEDIKIHKRFLKFFIQYINSAACSEQLQKICDNFLLVQVFFVAFSHLFLLQWEHNSSLISHTFLVSMVLNLKIKLEDMDQFLEKQNGVSTNSTMFYVFQELLALSASNLLCENEELDGVLKLFLDSCLKTTSTRNAELFYQCILSIYKRHSSCCLNVVSRRISSKVIELTYVTIEEEPFASDSLAFIFQELVTLLSRVQDPINTTCATSYEKDCSNHLTHVNLLPGSWR